MFTLKASHLEALCALNEFPVDTAGMVFVGIRGCLPIHQYDHADRAEQPLTAANVDHVHPRCTFAQWLPGEGVFAVYPGSTVPHRDYLQIALAGGDKANQLMTGYFDDYRKGMHKAGKPTGHRAFRQTANRAYRRTHNDLKFDLNDPVEYGNPVDNLHAAWCGSIEDADFASAGCQVVLGYPQCEKRGNQPSTGPWKTFVGQAYDLAQERFGYVLLNGSADVRRIALFGEAEMERVRFGSVGARAKRVQAKLKDVNGREYYEGALDGEFGGRSLRALLEFQEDAFGPDRDDGICGPQTADALGIPWP